MITSNQYRGPLETQPYSSMPETTISTDQLTQLGHSDTTSGSNCDAVNRSCASLTWQQCVDYCSASCMVLMAEEAATSVVIIFTAEHSCK